MGDVVSKIETEIKINEDGLSARMTGNVLHLFADKLVDCFTDSGAINHLECNFEHRDTEEEYTLVMQKKSGITQGEKNELLQARIDDLEILVKRAFIEGCSAGYHEGLSDGQSWSSHNCSLDKECEWESSEAKELLRSIK